MSEETLIRMTDEDTGGVRIEISSGTRTIGISIRDNASEEKHLRELIPTGIREAIGDMES